MSYEVVIARNKLNSPEVAQITCQSIRLLRINYTAYHLFND